jgi:hypothetical protein
MARKVRGFANLKIKIKKERDSSQAWNPPGPGESSQAWNPLVESTHVEDVDDDSESES